MSLFLWAHIAGGLVALLGGAAAIAVGKGGRLHARAGTAFVGAMLVLGATALVLDVVKPGPGSGVGGLVAVYFVATAWSTARRRDGTTGRLEIVACALALGAAAIMARGALTGSAAPTPVGLGPVFALAGVCLLAGVLDLNAILRARLSPARRISRHVWRMCFALFIATGSFFLGQQDVLPQPVRGSMLLLVLAFAPFAVMAFWLVRIRLAKRIGRLALRIAPSAPAVPAEPVK